MEDSAVKQLLLSGEQLGADVRLPLLYYELVKSGLEPKQRKRSMKLQDIQYILKNDLKVTSSSMVTFDGDAVSIQSVLLKSKGSDPALSVLLMELNPLRRAATGTELLNRFVFYSIFLFVLQDLVKSESGHTGEISKAQRSAVLADVNICWASAFSFQKRTVEFQEKEMSKAGEFLGARCPSCAPQSTRV